MERQLQRKSDWTELPAVLAEGLLRLHGAGSAKCDHMEVVQEQDDLCIAYNTHTGTGHERSSKSGSIRPSTALENEKKKREEHSDFRAPFRLDGDARSVFEVTYPN